MYNIYCNPIICPSQTNSLQINRKYKYDIIKIVYI